MTALAEAPRLPRPMLALIRKEFREYRQHRAVLLTALGLPAFFIVLPVLQLLGLPGDADQSRVNLAVGQAMFTFFLTPVVVPAALAAYSVMGEKEQGTLEPLLTLPITDRQFIHGKIAAIVGPSAAVAIGVYAVYYLIGLVGFTGPERGPALDPIWAVGVLGLAVPLSLYSTLVGMTISSRAKDLRVAEQLAGMIILPTLVPVALVTFQVVPVTLGMWAIFLAIALVVDAALLRLTYRMFERERAVAMVA